jgi:hypothetical protein
MYLIGLRYVDALPAIAQGKGSTVFLPVEAAGVMGAVGALKEVLKAGGGQAEAAGKATGALAIPPAGSRG